MHSFIHLFCYLSWLLSPLFLVSGTRSDLAKLKHWELLNVERRSEYMRRAAEILSTPVRQNKASSFFVMDREKWLAFKDEKVQLNLHLETELIRSPQSSAPYFNSFLKCISKNGSLLIGNQILNRFTFTSLQIMSKKFRQMYFIFYSNSKFLILLWIQQKIVDFFETKNFCYFITKLLHGFV